MHLSKRVSHWARTTEAHAMFNVLTSEPLFDFVESHLPAHRERVFPPTQTLSMFLTQVLSADGSCQQVVNETMVRRVFSAHATAKTNTGAYCKARARLAVGFVSALAVEAGARVSQQAPRQWRWRGRRVRLVDGTTVTMADTPDNQALYPQQSNQKPGLGFPICRAVAMLCLESGALLNAATAPCVGKGTDEQTLLRSILDTLECGDVLLGDAFYATYFLLCELTRRGIDGLFEQYGARRRKSDFRLGQQLGVRDHLVAYDKPKNKPHWMSQHDYDQAPDTLTVRELKVGGKILVTTMLCPNKTTKKALKTLYWRRWNVEMDLRNLKTTLGMEHLRCKTPQMAMKELWTYLLAYNLIRMLMAQSARLADLDPRYLSFKHTVQLWLIWQHYVGRTGDAHETVTLLLLIAERRVGQRPGRIEPRAVKRRPKPYPFLTQHRRLAREEVLQHGHFKKQK